MKEMYLNNCEIIFDEKKTHGWYKNADEWGCECLHCLNFLKLAGDNGLPEYVYENLSVFGIPATKATYVGLLDEISPDKLLYQFSYRIAGTVIPVECTEIIDTPEGSVRFCHETYPYGAPDFPEPHFDIEFFTYLPWLMDENNE